MESIGQTKKRKKSHDDENEGRKFKKRSSGNATVAYLREKNKQLQEMHKEKLEMKRMQLEREGNLMKLMVSQQQQQQKQMQEF